MTMTRQFCFVVACLAGIAGGIGLADADPVDYLTQVKPLLRERCYACHGALKQEAGLRLDTAAFVKQGSDSGAVITSGKSPEDSLLIERVSDASPATRMPPEFEGEALSPQQIGLLKKWIAAGAPAPADEQAEVDPARHWAFLPVERPDVPHVQNATWIRNPIDAWIAKGHQEHGLVPQTEASRVLLLRRLTLDLIGVPPTTEELAAFVNDPSPEWYEKTVDRLLDDPRHGERWARHWMDNWRYSDWWGLGTQLRNSQQHLWHWRDWIVESLNRDTRYDEMVRLMLAADEVAPADPEKLRATGYLARNFFIFNRTQWLDETVEHVSKGFLGLTFNCAKCHDHKFDPITHADYFKMRAFFEPYQVRLDMVPGEVDVSRDAIPRAFDALLDAPTYRFIRGDEAQPDKSIAIAPGVPKLLEFDSLEIENIELPPEAWQPARQPWVLESHLAAARKRLAISEERVAKAAAALEKVQSSEEPRGDEALAGQDPRMLPPIMDDFSVLNASRWKFVSGSWTHRPGFVEQSLDGPTRSVLQLLQEAPQNFDATIRFRLQGGSRYRSVGIAFDAPANGTTAEPRYLVYASGHASDSKVQAAYSDQGAWHYPGEARQRAEVALETDYTLRVQVRGTLINASLNGKPAVAWQTPIARRAGAMQLITFDALATIFEFKLATLADDVQLREPGAASSSPVHPLAAARDELARAKGHAAAALAELEGVQARADAMKAMWNSSDPSVIREKRVAAILAERKHAFIIAQNTVMDEEIAVARAAADQQADAKKKLTKANEALAKAEAKLGEEVGDDEQFSPLAGARWSATRFQSTGKDDPVVEFPATSTGRRKALAQWITDRRNPLTARVAANHIWTRHLGEPLVSTTFDFGRNGTPPTHPELLDWLASELMDSGWSMKHLHRLIVLSNTYRMGSSTAGLGSQVAKDPDNRFWWRRSPIRMESQLIRDSLLAHAGTLDETMGGPPVLPRDQKSSRRRSLYFFHSNNEKNLLLSTFDEASVTECYRREQSIVPQQALALSNSDLVLESSGQIASALANEAMSDEAFVRQAFLVLLGIEADGEEISHSLAAVAAWKALPEGTVEMARANLVWALINHNDYVTLR